MGESPVERLKKILIADDDEGSLDVLARWFEREGFEVILASNGEEALLKAQESAPDLIFLDIVMPKMDGYALLLQLKGSDRTHQIPVFIVSGLPAEDHGQICRTFGAVDFIEKPFELADLAGKVARAIS